jgi:DNA-directed RNA polymerase specialized sigma24 family protein
MRFVDMKGDIGPIVTLMSRYLADRSRLDADELAQQAWLAILSSPDGHHQRLAWWAMVDLLRKDRSWKRGTRKRPAREGYDHRERVDDRIDARHFLSLMPPKLREVAYMRFWLGYEPREIARRLGVSGKYVTRRNRELRQYDRTVTDHEYR